MSSNTQAIGALVLVPIVIAASAAYIAIKTTEGYKRLSRYCNHVWLKSSLNQTESRRRRKLYRSDISSNPAYGDTWVDLESVASRQGISAFINQTPPRRYANISKESDESDTVRRVWLPPRDSRLTWSFADPKPHGLGRSGLSSVARPLPVVHRPERSSTEDEMPHLPLWKSAGARHTERIDR